MDAAGSPGSSFESLAPLLVLGAYLTVLVVLGIWGSLKSRAGEEDYYLAAREQGWIVSSLTIMATFFSSFALLGAPGKVYTDGAVFALFALNVPLSGACVWLFGSRIARLGRRYGYVTPGDMVADYYGGHAVRLLVALASFLYVVPYVVMQVQAGGLLFDTLIERKLFARIGLDNFTGGTLLLGVVTTAYVLAGGMRSVAWTDVLQGLLLMAGMLLGGFVVVEALGGPRGFGDRLAALPPEYLTAPGPGGNWPWTMMLTVCLFGSAGSMVAPALWMRYYAARSTGTLRRSAVIFALVLTACFLFGVMLVGLGGRALYPDGAGPDGAPFRPDQILVVVLHHRIPELFPAAGVWIASVVVMAIAAASMSTADSNLHALSAVLTRDVYDRYVRPAASERERVWAGRAVIVLAGALALYLVVGGHLAVTREGGSAKSLVATSLKMIADIGFLAISFCLQLLPLAADMLWIRRGTRLGAALGLGTGLATTALVYRLKLDLPVFPGVWGLLSGTAVFTAVSLFGTPPERRKDYEAVLDS